MSLIGSLVLNAVHHAIYQMRHIARAINYQNAAAHHAAFLAVVGLMVFPFSAMAAGPLDAISIITNGGTDNALSIIQETDVGTSRARSGALFVDNTKNDNTGLTVYSNAGGTVAQPLMRLEVDNPEWSEEVLYIHSDSPTSRGLIRLDSPAPEIEFVETDQTGAAGKFELRVQHDTFQINSRRRDDTTFENKITFTHDGDLLLEEGTLFAKGSEPATFAGGINITDGCIAIDGACVFSSSADLKDASDQTQRDEQTPAASPAGSIPLSAGAPDPIGCNSYTERGAITLDHEQNRLYICNGPERGWDYTTLTD